MTVDFLDFVVTSSRDEVALKRPSDEHGGSRDVNLRIGAWPFAPVESLHCEVNEELVGGKSVIGRGLFDTVPLFGRDPDGFRNRLCH